MKKIILVALMGLFSTGISYAQDAKKDLPQVASDFIEQHFTDATIEKAEKNDSWYNFDKNEMYEVKLSNGIKLDFDKEGNITEIDGTVAIPQDVLPENIYTYVDENYTDAEIVSWEMDEDEQEVRLSDGTELEFDAEGNFIKED